MRQFYTALPPSPTGQWGATCQPIIAIAGTRSIWIGYRLRKTVGILVQLKHKKKARLYQLNHATDGRAYNDSQSEILKVDCMCGQFSVSLFSGHRLTHNCILVQDHKRLIVTIIDVTMEVNDHCFMFTVCYGNAPLWVPPKS